MAEEGFYLFVVKVVVVGWFLDSIRINFSFTPFSSSNPIHLLSSFVCGSWKRIKDKRKEKRILLYSNFILGFNDYSVVGWNVFLYQLKYSLLPNKILKYIRVDFDELWVLRSTMCIQYRLLLAGELAID